MATAAGIAHGPASARGIALIVGLVILAVLSMIGVAAFSISTQEERMAGNSRDRIRAFEWAEAALRDCEIFAAANAATAFTGGAGAPAGMYLAQPSTVPSVAETLSPAAWLVSATAVHRYACPTAACDWAAQPACVAEQFSVQRGPTTPGQAVSAVNSASIVHITAQGYGLNRNTVVKLESYYALN